jgi:putative DNA methylase
MNPEVISRRRLPHWYRPGAALFVTYRLAGTIPADVLAELDERREAMIRQHGPGCRVKAHKLHFAAFDAYLDRGPRDAWLSRPVIASLVRDSLYFNDGKLYHLIAYCVMPNHVHVLFQPKEIEARPGHRSPLSRIMHSLKGYTGSEANAILGRSGMFWQGESYDHWVRDDEEIERIVAYIAANPVKAGLVEQPRLWTYSSAFDRFARDGCEEGWLPIPEDVAS